MKADADLDCDAVARFEEVLTRLRRPLDKERTALKEAAQGRGQKDASLNRRV